MSCGLLVDYSSSSDEDAVTKAGKDNGGRKPDSPRSVDPDSTNLSEDDSCSHVQQSRDLRTKTLSRGISPSFTLPLSAKRLKPSNEGDGEQVAAVDSSLGEKRSDALPLPSAILDMFKEQEWDEQGAESSVDHEGRVRSFPHVRGNWATHVYLPIELSIDVITGLTSFGNKLNKYFKGHAFHMFPPSDLHVSLSRTVPVQHHCIEPLVDAVRSRVSQRTTFDVHLSNIAVYINDEKTRSFVGLEVDQGHKELSSLVQDVDTCFSKFRLSQFYQSPSFHVSFCWCLNDILSQASEDSITKLQEEWCDHILECSVSLTSLTCRISEVRLKSGNKLYSIPLSCS